MKNSSTSILKSCFALVMVALLSAVWTTRSLAQTPAKTANSTNLVNVNSADLKTLETLPGVGPSIGQKIIDGRPYKGIEDLEAIKGLGKTKADALKDMVTFEAPAQAKHTNAPKTPAADSAGTAAPTATNGLAPESIKSTAKAESPTTASAKKLTPGQQVNINTASLADLEKLPGIGPVKAQAVIDYRTQNGSFKSIEDIENVKGIKEGTFSKIKGDIKVAN